MATSGTTAFELDVSDTIEEAFERIGIEVRSGYQARSARRSLDLLLQHLANQQINLWKAVLTSQALVAGTTSYTLASDILDISDVVLRRSSIDTKMHRLSRNQYQTRPKKSTQARPSQFWLERLKTPVLHIYPAPENSTDVIRFYAMERIEDVGAATKTLDIPSRYADTVVCGLAYYLSMKYNAAVMPIMKQIYDDSLRSAMDEDRERVSVRFVPSVRLP